MILLAWNFRDVHGCEYASAFVLLVGLVIAWRRRGHMWLRGLTALGVYVLATVLASPQSVRLTNMADVRYLSPLILLCVWATTRSIVDSAAGGLLLAGSARRPGLPDDRLVLSLVPLDLAFDFVGVCR